MPTLDLGDRLYTIGGSPTWLTRPSVPLSTFSGGGSIMLSGEGKAISFSNLYRTQPWVAAVVNKLARQIATLPLKVYEIDSQGDRKQIHDHPLARLLQNPYPRSGPVHLKQKMALPTLLHGNAIIVKFRKEAGGPPTELLPLDWRFVIPRLDSQSIEIVYWETSQQSAPSRFIPPDEIVHLSWEAPDGSLGVSPLQQLGITLRSEDAAQRYAAASFDNGARPSGALVYPSDVSLDEDDKQDIRNEIQLLHGGVDNAFRVALLGGGVDWKPFAHNAQEAELVQTRKLNREEVAAVYDVPPPMVGILDQATYSNITEQHIMLYRTVLRPWLTLIEETLQAQLIDPEPAFEGVFVEFDLSEQLKGSPLERGRAASFFVHSGIYTLNEWRKIENLPRIDNPLCDEPLIPVNNVAPVGSAPLALGEDQTGEPQGASALNALNVPDRIERMVKRLAEKAETGDLDASDPDLGRLRQALNS